MHTCIRPHAPSLVWLLQWALKSEKVMKVLQSNEPSLAFSDSLEHTAQFCASIKAQHKVHELVKHDSSVHLFPSLHSFRSFIKKSYELHQCTILNNRLCPAVEKSRKRLSLTWLYIPSVYERSADNLVNTYTVMVSFCLYLVCLYIQWSIHLYLMAFHSLSVYV